MTFFETGVGASWTPKEAVSSVKRPLLFQKIRVTLRNIGDTDLLTLWGTASASSPSFPDSIV
jgi:hypothetical protein